MKPLSETPDEVRETFDDAEAETLLDQLGLLNELPDLTGEPEPAEPRTDILCDINHPTHWILALRYRSYPAAADNGYVVRCLPKSRCTLEQFKAIIDRDSAGLTPID